MDRLMMRERERIKALEGMRMNDYSIAILELRTVLDLMTKARDYMKNVSSRTCTARMEILWLRQCGSRSKWKTMKPGSWRSSSNAPDGITSGHVPRMTAYVIRDAVVKLERALAEAGYAPR